MTTEWTDRTIEESGALLGERWLEARSAAGELESAVARADGLLSEMNGVRWDQIGAERWDVLADALDDVDLAADNLRGEMGRLGASVEELREQGVV